MKVKYYYSLLRIDYPDRLPKTSEKIRVICSIHGEFKIRYGDHKTGKGCSLCNGGIFKWTKEKCIDNALKYKKRCDWKKNSSGAYKSAKQRGWLDECTKHMNYTPNGYWIKENCIKEAKKYPQVSIWQRKSPSSYIRARLKGWLKECTKHMKSSYKPKGYWTKERCKQDALRCCSRREWKLKFPKSYDAAVRNKWLDECL